MRRPRAERESINGPAEPLAGTVVSAADKHPLSHATVTLTGQRSGRDIASVVTDASGRFHMAAQPAGRYRLRATAAGFRSQLYLEHDGFSTAIVLGKGLPTGHLDFALVPGASIHGRVVDEAGEPIQRAQVQLYRERDEATDTAAPQEDGSSRVQHAGTMQTDDDGRYAFSDLQPGRYYLSVSAQPWYAVHPPLESDGSSALYRTAVDPVLDVVYPEIFYPGATTDEGAHAIALRPGQRVSANVALVPQRALSLRVHVAPSAEGSPDQRMPVLSRRVFGVDEPVNTAWTGFDTKTGIATLSGLTAGTYRMQRMNSRDQTAESTVSVGSGPAQTVEFAAAGGTGSLRVRIATVDGSPLPDDVTVDAFRQRMGGLQHTTAQKGIAEFSSLAAGGYRVQVAREGDRWTTVRVRQDGRTLPSQLAVVAAGGTAEAELLVTPYAPSLHGTVFDAAHAVMPGATVVLVPAGTESSAELFRRDQSDLDGSFELNAVAPGNYLLVAIENGYNLPFANAAALEPYLLHAVPVVVPTAGPATVEIREGVTVQSLR